MAEFAKLASPRYAFGDFVLERAQQEVRRRDGSALNLSPRLFNALLLFVEHAGELLDKDALMRALWPGLVLLGLALRHTKRQGTTPSSTRTTQARRYQPRHAAAR